LSNKSLRSVSAKTSAVSVNFEKPRGFVPACPPRFKTVCINFATRDHTTLNERSKSHKEPAIARHVALNPFFFHSPTKVGLLFGFGPRAMTALLRLGAPIVAKKICPAHFILWLKDHTSEIGKL
jgi:hypothetical protein